MITMEQVNVMNIDDYIRQEKHEGRRDIRWDKPGADILRIFTKRAKHNGEQYLGANHYE